MLKNFAILFGVVFLLLGVMGFIPQFTPEGKLLGVFRVNTAHNWVNILSGVAGLAAGFTSNHASRWYFKIFGIILLLLTILGFVYGNRLILDLIANNDADNWLHLALSAAFLYLGFFYDKCCNTICHKDKNKDNNLHKDHSGNDDSHQNRRRDLDPNFRPDNSNTDDKDPENRNHR